MGSRVRYAIGAALVAAVAGGGATLAYRHAHSPDVVAQEYVRATTGHLDGLRETTVSGSGADVAEILRTTRAAQRTGPVEVTATRDEPGPHAVRYVVVSGTSAGAPFTTGVTLYSQDDGWTWRVGSEWAP